MKSIPTVGGKGADRVLNYQTEDWAGIIRAECPGGLDLVYDCAGQEVTSKCIPLMKPLGRIVTIVNPTGKLEEGYRRNVAIHYEFLQRRRGPLEMLKALLERKLIVPLIDSVLPLEQVAEAHRRLEAGGVKGKIILKVAP